MKRSLRPVSRLLAGLLISVLTLTLPHPAVALRTRPTAEGPARAGLEEALGGPPRPSSAGLEEIGRPGVPPERRAIIFGAGNIGRGHLGPLLTANNMDLVYTDALPALIQALQEAEAFKVIPVAAAGEQPPLPVRHYWGIPPERDGTLDTAALEAQAHRADWIFTCVGAGHLNERLADTFLAMIQARWQAWRRAPLNIIFAENLPVDQPQVKAMRDLVVTGAQISNDAKFRDYVEQQVGFVGAVVQIAVPPQPRGRLDVRIEGGEYDRALLLDAHAIQGPPPSWAGVRAVGDLRAYRERKLLLFNMGDFARAVLMAAAQTPPVTSQDPGAAQLNPAVGLRDPGLAAIVRRAMQETAAGLTRAYPGTFPPGELARYVEEFVGDGGRFLNVPLGDTVERIARDPARKLGANERLMGALRHVVAHALPREALTLVTAAAIRYLAQPGWEPQGLSDPLRDVWRQAQRLAADEPAFRAAWDRLAPAGAEESAPPDAAAPTRRAVAGTAAEVVPQMPALGPGVSFAIRLPDGLMVAGSLERQIPWQAALAAGRMPSPIGHEAAFRGAGQDYAAATVGPWIFGHLRPRQNRELAMAPVEGRDVLTGGYLVFDLARGRHPNAQDAVVQAARLLSPVVAAETLVAIAQRSGPPVRGGRLSEVAARPLSTEAPAAGLEEAPQRPLDLAA